MQMAIYKVKVFFWTQNICIEDAKNSKLYELAGLVCWKEWFEILNFDMLIQAFCVMCH